MFVRARAARELVREVDYTLKTLAQTLLGQERHELLPAEIPQKYTSCDGLKELMMHTESDAWLSLGIMIHLSGLRFQIPIRIVITMDSNIPAEKYYRMINGWSRCASTLLFFVFDLRWTVTVIALVISSLFYIMVYQSLHKEPVHGQPRQRLFSAENV